ncbi:hypothetical protein CI102_3508 [Trichoderma harzianum]|nr:hypothetical protein CI102_3508 [Trichoderma harzianum]
MSVPGALLLLAPHNFIRVQQQRYLFPKGSRFHNDQLGYLGAVQRAYRFCVKKPQVKTGTNENKHHHWAFTAITYQQHVVSLAVPMSRMEHQKCRVHVHLALGSPSLERVMYHIGRASGECLPALTAIVLTTRNYQLALLLREGIVRRGETPGPIAETLEGLEGRLRRRCRKKRNCRKRKTAMGPPRALAPREREKKVLRFLMQPSLDEGNERGGVACGIIRHLYSLSPAVSSVGSSWAVSLSCH